jgi:hypothetical protein
MDAMLLLFAITTVLVLVGAAAAAIGVDTRDGFASDAALGAANGGPRGLA